MADLNLAGRRALVTGGANGIGRAIAEALLQQGADVTVADREPASVPGARCVEADVTDAASLARAFDAAAPLDILMVNAGIALPATLDETKHEDWERTLAVNLSGAFHSLRLAAAAMKPRRAGAIVLTASTNSYDGEPGLIAYNASKAGLLGLLHSAANELGPYGVRVNAVCPGLIRTRLTAGHFADAALMKDYFRQIPLGRGGLPEEVANAAVFLASPLASYITGAALLVDGGQLASKFGPWNESFARFTSDHWELT